MLKTIKTLKKSAELVYNTKDFTSATILYFKTAFAVLDLIILKAAGNTPKDHSERFKILKKFFPEFYEFLDKYFDVYRDTYSLTIDKQTCDKIKENVEEIIKKRSIQI